MGARKRVQVFAVTVIGAVACLGGTANAGTPNDASLVADLTAGAGRPILNGGGGPKNLTAVGDKLFFTADAETGLGRELYVTDGITTNLVEDIRPGMNVSSDPQDFVALGGTLLFRAHDGANGIELWKSDGTAAGTDMVKDINPTGTNQSSNPSFLTNVNGTVYFSANDGVNGFEVWKTDGTSAGTVPLGNADPNPGGSAPVDLAKVGNSLYFSAVSPTAGRELWKTDGGTPTLVQDITPGGASTDLDQITDVNGVAYLRANNGTNGYELWKANAAGTSASMVQDLFPGSAQSGVTGLTAAGNTLYMQGNDGSAVGRELYKSDGNTITLVKDINDPGQSIPRNITNVGGTLFFTAGTADGDELWKSDGTGPGTVQVKDINTGPASAFPSFQANIDGVLYFSARSAAEGAEWWRSDGTSGGTVPIEDIEAGTGDSVPGTGSSQIVGAGGTVYFAAFQTATGLELWKYADTIAPTVAIDSGPAAGSTITTGSPTFGFSSNDTPTTFECRLYATGSTPPAFGACSAAASHTPPSALANGSYTFDVRGTDVGKNVGNASRSFTVAIPVTNPPGGDSAACKKAKSDLEAAKKKLDKAKASLKKTKKSKKSSRAAKIKKAKAKVKKAKAGVKDANAAVADAC